MKVILMMSEVAQILMHKDKRFKATINWLNKHQVSIYPKEKNNSRKFVVGSEFYPVYNDWCNGTISLNTEPMNVKSNNRSLTNNMDSEIKKIELKEKQAIAGLVIRCKCKKEYKHEGLVKCSCTKFKYKVRLHISGKNKDFRKTLKAENYEDALIELGSYKKQLNKSDFNIEKQNNENVIVNEEMPFYETVNRYNIGDRVYRKSKLKLKDAIKDYVESLYDTEDRVLTKENNQEAERFFSYAMTALMNAGINADSLLFEDVDYKKMKIIRLYFKNMKGNSPPYFNKALGRMSSLWAYTILANGLGHCVNVFDAKIAKRMKYNTNPEAFPCEKFEELLNVVTYENGWKFLRKKMRNLYRPYLKDLFKLGLYIGGRRAIVVGLRWSDIIFKDGKPIRIEIEARKENLAKQIKQDKYKKKFDFTLTKELLDFLIEKGLLEKRGTNGEIYNNDYIIAPEQSRENLMRLITDSFPHYCSKLNLDRKYNFKQLRKAYITNVRIKQLNGERTELETGHAKNSRVISDAYEDKSLISSALSGSSLFTK